MNPVRGPAGGRGFRLAVLGLALAASAACTPRRSVAGGADPCTRPGADTAGWTVVDAGPFQFSVPPGYRRRTVQGIDSFVGRWEAPGGGGVGFDWGMYSAPLDEPSTRLQGRVECTVGIGGQRAKVVSGFDSAGSWSPRRAYVAAAAWRDVRPDIHLTLTAMSPDSSDVPVLLSIVRSVRFKPGQPIP